jgi:hypothetical protein
MGQREQSGGCSREGVDGEEDERRFKWWGTEMKVVADDMMRMEEHPLDLVAAGGVVVEEVAEACGGVSGGRRAMVN